MTPVRRKDHLCYYFVANDDVTYGAKKHSILLAVCRAPAYKVIHSLVQAKKKMDSMPYEEFGLDCQKSLAPKAVSDNAEIQV